MAETLVGRDAEIALLQELLAKVEAGTGGTILVEGEQGIGKTELLRAGLAGAADLECQVLWAVADELEQRFPLRLMEECLGAAAPEPESAEALTTAVGVFSGDPVLAATERMLARVERLCAVSPVVLVTEDLHWADEASVLVWSRLARAVWQMPLLLVGSLRPGAIREDLDRLRRGIATRGGHVIELGPLPGPQVTELVRELVGASPGRQLAGLMGRAGGNPLYARELADSLIRDGQIAVTGGVAEIVAASAPVRVPVSLDAAIGERLAGLPEDTIQVLRWAAVLGADFSVTDLQVVSGRSAGELMRMIGAALRAGVLAEAGTRLEFRHGLIRQVLYEALPAGLRAALHVQAAQALATAGAAAERVATQLTAAGAEITSDWAAGWLAAQGPVLSYRAPQVAAELLRGVLARLGPDDDRREALEASLATVSFLLLRPGEVERIGGRLAATARDPGRAAEMAWLVAYSRMRTGRLAEAESVIEAALARPGAGQGAARLAALRAMIRFLSGQPDESQRLADEALAAGEKSGDRLAAGYVHHIKSMLSWTARDSEAALQQTSQALAVLGDDPHATDLRVLVLANRTSLLGDMDRRPEAIAEAREALALAEQAGTPRIATARQALAAQYFFIGQWDDALAELDPAVGMPGPDYLPFLLNGLISLIAAHRDDWPAAEDYLRRLPEEPTSHTAALATVYHVLQVRAMAAERAGKPDEAARVLAAAALDHEVSETTTGRILLLLPLVRLALTAGDTATAARAAAVAREEADRDPLRFKVVMADHANGLVTGDAAAVLAAAKYYESAGRVLAQAEALEDAAALLAGQGDANSAKPALASALGVYQRLGAVWDMRRADARLRQHGIRRARASSQRRPQTGWAALTPTEAKVAALVAEGRSNPDIAAHLFLSRNTVQTHVSHILTKLGARSRTEIIRVALQHS